MTQKRQQSNVGGAEPPRVTGGLLWGSLTIGVVPIDGDTFYGTQYLGWDRHPPCWVR